MLEPSREKDFILLIGQALSIFGRMEMALGQLFVAATRTEDPKTAERVFWAVNSLEARTAMTGAALKSAFAILSKGSELPALWADIAAAIQPASSKRAELAHGNWIGMAWNTKKGLRQDQFFAPYYGKSSIDINLDGPLQGKDPRPNKRLYIPDLEARKIEFSSLELKVSHLRARLRYELSLATERTEEAARLASRRDRLLANQRLRESRQPRKPKGS